MKDKSVLEGNGLKPYEPESGDRAHLLVVRNNTNTGRRLGIYSKQGNVMAGQVLNHADVLHEIIPTPTTPVGYNSGKEAKLSAKRNYHLAFAFSTAKYYGLQGAIENPELANFAEGVSEEIVSDNKVFKIGAVTKDLGKLRSTLNTSPYGVYSNRAGLLKYSFVSFSIVFGGQPYHLSLDLGRYPALITAILNLQLSRIHPQLRGYIKSEFRLDPEQVDYEIYLAAPDGLEVIIPSTSFATQNTLINETGLVTDHIPNEIGCGHLNGESAAILNKNGVTPTTYDLNSLSTAGVIQPFSKFIENAYPVDLTDFQQTTIEVDGTPVGENVEFYRGVVSIPASEFKTPDYDHRLNFAMLKLQRDYTEGKVFNIRSIRYLTAEGNAIDFLSDQADLLLVNAEAHKEGFELPVETVSVLINEVASSEPKADPKGYGTSSPSHAVYPETGGVNGEQAAYIGLFPMPNQDNANGYFFRKPISATYIEIIYELRELDVVPDIDIEMRNVQYLHAKKYPTEELASEVLVSPSTEWNLNTKNPDAEEYVPATLEEVDEHGKSYLTVTNQTQEDLLGKIDYSLIKKHLEGSTNQPYYAELNLPIDVMLTADLKVTEKKTGLVINDLSRKYYIHFPDHLMTMELNPIPSIFANVKTGTTALTGMMLDNDPNISDIYDQTVLEEASSIETMVTYAGASITPVGNVLIDTLTGNLSANFNTADLTALGVGKHVLRLTVTATYPWIEEPVVYTQSVTVDIASAVNGIESDVTFIPNNLYNQDLISNEDSTRYKIMDLDTGEVLAEGVGINELIENATTTGKVSVDYILEEPVVAERPEISCEGAPNSVTMEIGGVWAMEVDGEIIGQGTMEELVSVANDYQVEISFQHPPCKATWLEGDIAQNDKTLDYSIGSHSIAYSIEGINEIRTVTVTEGYSDTYDNRMFEKLMFAVGEDINQSGVLENAPPDATPLTKHTLGGPALFQYMESVDEYHNDAHLIPARPNIVRGFDDTTIPTAMQRYPITLCFHRGLTTQGIDMFDIIFGSHQPDLISVHSCGWAHVRSIVS